MARPFGELLSPHLKRKIELITADLFGLCVSRASIKVSLRRWSHPVACVPPVPRGPGKGDEGRQVIR